MAAILFRGDELRGGLTEMLENLGRGRGNAFGVSYLLNAE